MDKIAIKFLADILYCKGILFHEEFKAVMEAKTPYDLDEIIEKMLRGEFNVYKRGEIISQNTKYYRGNNPV